VGGLIRNIDNLYFNLLLLYSSTKAKYLRRVKQKTGGSRRKKLGFVLFLRFAWREPKKWWNRKFCAWNRPISTILADSVCGIIGKAEAFPNRARKK
jgi:hypothetical protein